MLEVLLGLLAGLVVDRAWWESGMDKRDKHLGFFEHYHWGLASWILYEILPSPISLFFAGFGAALVITEWEQEHPFSYGSEHFTQSTIIGLLLLSILFALAYV